jgi:DNA-binding MarR family transcriptional regulator
MHPLSFLQKRAHLCAVARGREMFAHVEDMTPARFDLLYLIFQGETELAKITAALGLARQTVWKMMDRLVQLGLIVKTNAQYPRRRIVLWLTEEGARRMRWAMNAAFSERWPLPANAPADEGRPRYWKRLELADDPALRSSLRTRPAVAPSRCKSGVRHPSDRDDTEGQDPNHALRYDATGLLYETSRGPRQRTRPVWCEHGARYIARDIHRASGGRPAIRTLRYLNAPLHWTAPLAEGAAGHAVSTRLFTRSERSERCAHEAEDSTPGLRRDGTARRKRGRIRCRSGARHESHQDNTQAERRARAHQKFAHASELPQRLGREVARIYSTFAWGHTGGGRRGKRDRYLLYLNDLISLTQAIAGALGNRAWPIYQLRFTEELDH